VCLEPYTCVLRVALQIRSSFGCHCVLHISAAGETTGFWSVGVCACVRV